MKSENSKNPQKGRLFELQTQKKLINKYKDLKKDKLPIGNPPKEHEFDLVSEKNKIIIECKKYSWTKTGNIPSAKKSTLNEAVLYLSLAPKKYKKILMLHKAVHVKKEETFAQYYSRLNNHLLTNISIWELDDRNILKIIKK